MEIKKTKINYLLNRSGRAKRLRIAVYCDARVVVTAPAGFSDGRAEKFIREKADWIIKKLKYFEQFKDRLPIVSDKANYLQHKNTALELVKRKAEYYSRIYDFKFNGINIKNQKTRWGSCSRKGNLNFSYKIALIPEKMADYIIIHELCHLKEFNHSKKFWNLVMEIMPDCMEARKELRAKGLSYC